MSEYSEIEQKWQKYYEEQGIFHASNTSDKEKYFYLVEFPYPSGDGLHVGHTRGYTALDVMARKKRMEGFNVLFPMAWDAFGEAAEGYAIKHKIHPKEAVKKNIATFKGQCQKMGFSFDWTREFSTTDESYMKWTQWQFLKFFENGMAYKAPAKVHWCPKCKITKSNEEAAGGVCDRCNTPVVEMYKEQWMLRMRDYAQELLDGLDDTNFQEAVKVAQINWIGRTEGMNIKFAVDGLENEQITVFTTRPDTIFGVTSVQISITHPLIKKYESRISNYNEIGAYIRASEEKVKRELEARKKASEGASKQERKQLRKASFKQEKEKTGVCIIGLSAVHPITGKMIPIYVSDYVLADKGTGAVMSVPAHDERDYVFAKKYGVDIIPVVVGGDISQAAYTGDGEHINSEFLNGLNNKEAFKKIREVLEKSGQGELKIDYKLDDWVFSRQRFWGEPVPLVKCPTHGWVAVPEEDLPVTLPDVPNYEPTDTGESPLANIEEWVNTTCPICGAPAKRETDTMPGWAGSSWYWLRFMDPHNDRNFASYAAMKYWGKVDLYDGGMEHAARHLLYARFWNQFLNKLGLVPNKEPVDQRIAHGMVLGEGGVKMSKSLGNVVRPDAIVDEYGADSLRTYIMFMGDYSESVKWDESGVKSCKKFIERVIRLGDKLVNAETAHFEYIINKTIKKVTEDISATKFNTAISALHELTRAYESAKGITKEQYRILLILFHPFAPHITEELNERYNLGALLATSNWPQYDETKLVENDIEIPIQINGKLRGIIVTGKDDIEEIVKQKALENENVKAALVGKNIVKIIFVAKRVVNIVVR